MTRVLIKSGQLIDPANGWQGQADLLFEDGRNIKQIQHWLGHHSAAYTLSTYVHLMDDGAGDAAVARSH